MTAETPTDDRTETVRDATVGDVTPDRFDVDLGLEILAGARRRAVLDYVAAVDRTDVASLVEYVAGVGRGDRESVEIALVHADLPRLADAGYVTYDHPEVAHCAPPELDALRESIEAPVLAGALPSSSLDTLCSLLAHPWRRAALLALDERGPLHVEDVGVRIATAHPGVTAGEVVRSLHHVHLPKLAAASAIEYDRATGFITPIEFR